MCRSIKPLRRADSDTTTGEIEAAALQFVRKVSNYRTPSTRNQEAFDAAVAEIADASRRMLETLGVEVVDGPNRWMTRAGEIRYERPTTSIRTRTRTPGGLNRLASDAADEPDRLRSGAMPTTIDPAPAGAVVGPRPGSRSR